MESYVRQDDEEDRKMRWLDDVPMDMRKMDISGWRDRARSREAWRRDVEKAKAHPGL
jgi:hypothetical protein